MCLFLSLQRDGIMSEQATTSIMLDFFDALKYVSLIIPQPTIPTFVFFILDSFLWGLIQ